MNIEATYGSDGLMTLSFYEGGVTIDVDLEPAAAAKLYLEIRRELERGFSVNELIAMGFSASLPK